MDKDKKKQIIKKTINKDIDKNIDKGIDNIIKRNNLFVNEINQFLHNEGIEINNRLDIIIDVLNHCLYNKKIVLNISKNIVLQLIKYINTISIDNDEIFQILFMFYCNKKTKINLDQYYTPFTIGKFISQLMIPDKSVIDPACGTGDLVKNYNGEITLWDISEDVLSVCEQNYKLNNKNSNIECLNSIVEYKKNNNSYDYCCLNPPFGSSTVITDKNILDNYILGKGKKKQEIGILFIERAINLLKYNGVAFIILPNGYLGNSTHNIVELKEYLQKFKIIAVIELPSNTFSRSGTGVSTSLFILQKQYPTTPYNIFIKHIENIGYVLNKKNTPYKYKNINGIYITENGKPILDNDLVECYSQISSFIKNENIEYMYSNNSSIEYEIVKSNEIVKNIIDINRYLYVYKNVIKNCKKENYKKIKNFIVKNPDTKYDKLIDKEYVYLDIKQITTPIYNKSNTLYGYELPGRAKINVKKYDILVSKLKGKITFTIILDDAKNIICTNGFTVFRPINYNYAIIIFANLFTNDFKIQHNSLCTGSIMESISEDDIKNIYINENIDVDKYENIIKSLIIINDI